MHACVLEHVSVCMSLCLLACVHAKRQSVDWRKLNERRMFIGSFWWRGNGLPRPDEAKEFIACVFHLLCTIHSLLLVNGLFLLTDQGKRWKLKRPSVTALSSFFSSSSVICMRSSDSRVIAHVCGQQGWETTNDATPIVDKGRGSEKIEEAITSAHLPLTKKEVRTLRMGKINK